VQAMRSSVNGHCKITPVLLRTTLLYLDCKPLSMSSLHSEDPESVSSTSNNNDVDGANRMTTADHERDLERKTLGKEENRAVFWSRILVILVLCTTAALVVTFVYQNMSGSQQESFEVAFQSDSLKIMNSFHRSVRRMIDSSDGLSIAYTSYALRSNSTFPNVTLPDYQIVTANTRIMSETVVFNYHPLVTDETRKGWEAYVVENRIQFNISTLSEYSLIASQNAEYNQSNGRNLQVVQGFQDEIGNLGMDGLVHPALPGTGPYLPIWQLSPFTPIPVLMNFNILSHPASLAYKETINSGQALICPAANLNAENSGDSGAYFQLILSMSQFRESVKQYLGDPTSPFSYPVFDSFDPLTRKVAGLISSTFYWRIYLENILPATRHGIYCVIQNTLNQTFTYRIDGSNASYVGAGDLHDTKYDHLKVASDMASYLATESPIKTKSYTVVPLNSQFNSYSLAIYPSQDNEDDYVNNDPVVLALTIVCVFLFTSMVFLIYDRYVARRQRVVMNRAVASSAIVSSLFPSQVRDNIYKENETKQKPGFTNTTDNDQDSEERKSGNASSSKPNAVLFPETTVMFADMAGFTSWSSTRGPVEVFELLEAVYRAFDAIAARRRVFKVETIGDCYVAVAGLPNPQPDHALIMVKFAEDCIVKIRQVTAKLAPSLGEDTMNLMIRIGLHSGPVTGGVLRGEKARFQLFGDTMNTASRMETNGLVGKIHVSEDTAQVLIARGKAHWLEPLPDKIQVKGKGELNTYWVSTRTHGSSGPRSSAASSNLSENEPTPPYILSLLSNDLGVDDFELGKEGPSEYVSFEI
jgi:class 3 adenylate cyclase